MDSFIHEASQWLPLLLRGALVTIEVTAVALVVACVWGLLLAMGKLSRIPVLHQLAVSYIEVLRSIPVLAILFVIYFGIAEVGIKLPSFLAAVIGLGLVGGAYMAENIRSGILAVPRGQREGALTLGMRPDQAMAFVILPQALRAALPPTVNYSIGLLKDTAIVSTVAAPELLFRAQGIVSLLQDPLPVYGVTAVIYLLMSLPLARLGRHLEVRLAAGGKR